jgi:hypothetical protein
MCASVTEITLEEITGVFTMIGFLARGNVAPMGLGLLYTVKLKIYSTDQ